LLLLKSFYCMSYEDVVIAMSPLGIAIGSDEPSCGSIQSPCLSFSTIHQWENDTSVIIEGNITLDFVIEIHLVSNLVFTSSPTSKEEGPAIITCACPHPEHNCGFIIEECQDVSFDNLAITGCSMLYQLNGYLYRSGMLITASTDIALEGVSISNSYGTGLVLKNAAGSIDILNSVFSNNSLPFALQIDSNGDTVHGGSGLVILVSACEVTASTCLGTSTAGDYNIQEVSFNNNLNNLTNLSTGDWLFTYGGGLSILLVWNVQGNFFNIENSNFTGNKASAGGGMIHHCQTLCNDNTLIVKDSLFLSNSLTSTSFGGAGLATGIAYFLGDRMSTNNNVTVISTMFYHNNGYYGGGALVYCNSLDPKKPITEYNHVSFINCVWEGNTGAISPAVEVEPNYRSQYSHFFSTKATFENCTFISNSIVRHYKETFNRPSYTFNAGIGVFIIAKVTVYFSGNNTFTCNSGTALFIIAGTAFFDRGATTEFTNNTGTNGGAVALVGYAKMKYNNDTSFIFKNNIADFIGGAIYVLNNHVYGPLSSFNCFLEYINDQINYSSVTNARFTFENNRAFTDVGNSLFFTSIKPCQLTCLPQFGSISKPNDLFVNQTCMGTFDFVSNMSERSEIASSGSFFEVDGPTPLSIIPGRKYLLPLKLLDEMGQDVTKITTFQPFFSNESNINISAGFQFVANNTIEMTGRPGERGNLTLMASTHHGSEVSASIDIKLASCPPGYVIEYNSTSCICSASQNNKSLNYNGIIGCKDNEGLAVGLAGYWIGYILSYEMEPPNQDNLYTTDCPLGFCRYFNNTDGSIKNKEYYLLTKEASKTDVEEIVCAENRRGTVCSQCKKGYSVYFHSETSKCGPDDLCNAGFIFYILSEIIPVTCLFFAIVYFDISLTTGLAYNFLFMIQLLQAMVVSVNGGVQFEPSFIRSIYTILYNMLNLDFFDIDELSFCLWKGAGTLDMISMKYVSVMYAIVLIMGFVFMFKHCMCGLKYKCCRKNTVSYSVVQGLTAFLVISYFQCSRVTFLLLNRESPRGIGTTTYKDIVFWDGSLEYFSSQHLWYAIPALMCLLLFVIPFPIMLSFDGLLLKIESRLSLRFMFIRRKRPYTALHYKLKPLLDSFQGAFKDEYRFFSGLYFFYRVLILALLVIATSIVQYYFLLEIALIVIIMIQAIVQPFQKKLHNIAALLIFVNMALINMCTIRIYHLVSTDGYPTETVVIQWLQMVLIYIPLGMGVAWLCYFFYKRCRDKRDQSVSKNDENYFVCDEEFPEEIFNRSESNVDDKW
uniref:Uncharacterized protein n=1 Tax=Amphimedon queenslandica TaxID=400682 RepID=A0A1X7U1G2_AMPQE